RPGGGVGVPGGRRSAGAAARLVLRPVVAHRRVVGLLRLPGDDPVLDVDLPGAGPGAVHPVRGADHLVVTPPVPVEGVAGAATLQAERAVVVRDLGVRHEEPPGRDQRGLQRALDGHLAGGHRLLPAWLGLAVDVLVPARSSPVRPGPAGAGESDDAEASMCDPEELQSRVEFVPNVPPPNWCGNQEHAAFFGRNFRTLTCPNTGAYAGELWWRIIARESRACCSWAPGQEWALTVPGSPALTVPGSPASSGWWWPGAGAAAR